MIRGVNRVALLACIAAAGATPAGTVRTQVAPDSILPIAEVRIAPDSVAVDSGDSVRFTATAYDSAGTVMPGVEFFWGVGPGPMGEIDSTGAFVARQPMEGLVLARAVNGPVIGRARVIVLPPPLVALHIEGPSRVVAGSYLPLVVIGKDRAGTTGIVSDPEWISSAPTVAEVEEGHLLSHAPGRAVLTARKQGVEARLALQVTPNRAPAIQIACRACPAPPDPDSPAASDGRVETGAAASTNARGTNTAPPGIEPVSPRGAAVAATRPISSSTGAADMSVRVGDAIRLEAMAGGMPGPAPVRWWLDGEGALLDGLGNFVAQRPGRFVVMAQFGRLVARRVIEALPRQRWGLLRLVGRGPVSNPRMSDLWAFQGADGRDYVYTGSIGGDQVKVWDVTDPENPVQTDSLVVDARVINDVNLNQSGRLGVLTREGASGRKNGIVLFDASDPAHPKITSEYTETVTSGVHNAFFDGDYIYCTNDGTRALHVISARDPLRPVEVARWEIRPGETNKYLHDVFVRDGLAYLSYWDDGLVILDVGDGVKGGSPENPVFVSRIAYPEGHTHTAWRWKNYVFTGDEIFGGPPVTPEGGVPAGFVHVIDVTELEHPVEVAKYEVPGAGSHNMWMDEENEILYVSYYNAGVRALDVSGRLMGDLMQQGRELAYFLTGEPDPAKAFKPNSPMSWGPQLYKGNVFAADMNSGLWVLKYEPIGGANDRR